MNKILTTTAVTLMTNPFEIILFSSSSFSSDFDGGASLLLCCNDCVRLLTEERPKILKENFICAYVPPHQKKKKPRKIKIYTCIDNVVISYRGRGNLFNSSCQIRLEKLPIYVGVQYKNTQSIENVCTLKVENMNTQGFLSRRVVNESSGYHILGKNPL